MSWLDPDRLAALYGQKALKKVPDPAVVSAEAIEKLGKKAKKKAKKALKKAAKAEKKALKKLEKLLAGKVVDKHKKKSECCEKWKKGRRCKSCPLAV